MKEQTTLRHLSWENTHNPFYCYNFLTSILDRKTYIGSLLDKKDTEDIFVCENNDILTMMRVTRHIIDNFANDFKPNDKKAISNLDSIDKINSVYEIETVAHSLINCTGNAYSFEANRDYKFDIYLTRLKEGQELIYNHIPMNMLKAKVFYAMFNDGITRYPSRMIFTDVISLAIDILNELYLSVKDNDSKDWKEYYNEIKAQRDRLEQKYFKGVFECVRKILIEGIPDLLETMYMISIIDTIQDSKLDGFTSLIEKYLTFGYDKESKSYKIQKLIDKFIYMIPLVPIFRDFDESINKDNFDETNQLFKKVLFLLEYTPEIEYIEKDKIKKDLDSISFAITSVYLDKSSRSSDFESYLETQLYFLDMLNL